MSTGSAPRGAGGRLLGDRPGRRLGVAALVVLVLAATAMALWRSAAGPTPSLAERTTAVAEGLRCPVCAGESVAASQSDLAGQMRGVVAQQLRDGRSPDQVRAWFAARYGDGVLLDPPHRGAGWLVLLIPALVLGGVVALLAGGRPARRLVSATAAGAACVAVSLLAVGALPAGDGWGPAPPAEPAWSGSAAADLDPLARRALAALTTGDAGRAEQLARDALGAAGADRRRAADALLVMGLAQREQGDPQAQVSLSGFLEEAPGHPLAARVRRLVSGAG